MIVFEDDYFELEYHPEDKILEVRWTGILDAESLVILIRQIVKAANTYAAENILLDATYVEATPSLPVTQEAPVQNYLHRKWNLPTVKKIARVASGFAPYDEAMTKQYATFVLHNAGLEFQTFTHHYEAMYWITGKSNPKLQS